MLNGCIVQNVAIGIVLEVPMDPPESAHHTMLDAELRNRSLEAPTPRRTISGSR